MYFKISDTNRGKKSFTCDGYLYREQDGKKLKDNNYEHE